MDNRKKNWQSVMSAIMNLKQELKIFALRSVLEKIFKEELTKQQKITYHILIKLSRPVLKKKLFYL